MGWKDTALEAKELVFGKSLQRQKDQEVQEMNQNASPELVKYVSLVNALRDSQQADKRAPFLRPEDVAGFRRLAVERNLDPEMVAYFNKTYGTPAENDEQPMAPQMSRLRAPQ